MQRRIAATFAVALALGSSPALSASGDQAPRNTPARKAAPKYDAYQVPAGSALLLKLRTPVDSATSAVDDQVDAVLWSPVIQDGVELIPEGSIVMGKIVEVAAATKRKPEGRVAFAFSVVEHSGTGSRAMVTTRKVVFEGQQPHAEGGRGTSRELVNAVIPAGTAFIAMTAEPLLVRIPR